MIPGFCASCIRDFAAGAPRYVLDGAVICARCNDEHPDGRVPEHRQRSYEAPEQRGNLKTMVAAGAARVIGAMSKDEQRSVLAPRPEALKPGHEIVRAPLRDRSGRPLDRDEARRLLGDESLEHVSSTARHHVFQRPAPVAPEPRNPLTTIERYRRKS